MLLEKLPLGKTLEIYVERDEFRYRLISKVEDANENRVCVTAIASNGKYFKFQETDSIKIIYKEDDSMWEWDHVKAGLAKLDGFVVHYFVISDKGKKFNRRNAYRVKLHAETMIGYYQQPGKKESYAEIPDFTDDLNLTEDEKEKWEEEVQRKHEAKALLKDLSENGIGLYCDHEFNVDDEMFFDIPSSYGDLSVKVMVVRKIVTRSSLERYDFYYGCVITESDRRILRYIFDLQRELLKKQKEM